MKTLTIPTLLAILTTATIPALPGYRLDWSDDFIGPSGTFPNPSNWLTRQGHRAEGGPPNWGTGEIQSYTSSPSNIRLTGNGHLEICPERQSDGSWTSGRLETVRTDFMAPAGGVTRIQAQIQLPDVKGEAARGYWPAFWILGNALSATPRIWPGPGEWDIMENVNGQDVTAATMHCGWKYNVIGGPCDEASGRTGSVACPGCVGNFRTWALEVDKSKAVQEMRFYVENMLVNSVSQEGIPGDVWGWLMERGGHFLILNVAMGGAMTGTMPTAETESGKGMLVDYVAVYYNEGPVGEVQDSKGNTQEGQEMGGNVCEVVEVED